MTAPSDQLTQVLPAAAALLAVPAASDSLGLAQRVGAVRRVVVVLVDGMGWHLLPAMAPHAPLLADAVAGRVGTLTEARCTFPSTTPTSLVSLGTGVDPGQHGILGFTVNIPGTDRVLTHIFWRDNPPHARWAPQPTWYEHASAAGVDARVVLPALFEGSGLTYAAYRGARFVAVGPEEDYADRLAAEVAAGPGLIFGYTNDLDTAAHAAGVDSPPWQRAAGRVDALLARLIETLPDDAALLVTADHGGLNGGLRFDIGTDPRLAAGLRVVAGEARVRYLYPLPGARDDVAATWREILGDAASVLTREQAVDEGLFGQVRLDFLDRIGDLVVVCNGDAVVLASDREPAELSKLVGFHGALTAAETAIPLLTVRR